MFKTRRDVDEHVRNALLRSRSEQERNAKGLSIAKLYHKINEFEIAIHYLMAYMNVKEDNDEAFRLLGNCYVHLKQGSKALPHYQRSLILNPKQRDLVVEVCKLLLDESTFSIGKARYWCDFAERERISDDAVFNLRIKISSEDNIETNQVENIIQKEIAARPHVAELRARLLQHYIDQDRLLEAFEYVKNVENTSHDLFDDNDVWYGSVLNVLDKYEKNPDTQTDWHYWLLLIKALDRKVTLSFSVANKEESIIAPLLLHLDQNLFKLYESKNKIKQHKPLVTRFINHYQGQVCLHMASLIFKRQLDNKLPNWHNSVIMSLPLLLFAYQSYNPEDNPAWVRHSEERAQALIKCWDKEAAFRCVQAGQTLYGCVEQNDDPQVKHLQNTKLWSSVSSLIDQVCRTCFEKTWRGSTFSFLFSDVVMKDKQSNSYFLNCPSLAQPEMELPSYAELESNGDTAQFYNPQCLRHAVYISLGIRKMEEIRAKYFSGLNLSVHNLAACGTESVTQLDVDSFLYATTLQAKRMLDIDRTGYEEPIAAKPKMLPFVNMKKAICTDEQMTWWSTVYKTYKNLNNYNLSELRANLRHGLQVIRGINGPKMETIIVFKLGNMFENRSREIYKPIDKEFMDARVESLYRNGLNMLKLHHRGVLEPYCRYFKYAAATCESVERELHQLAENAVNYIATVYFRKAEFEDLINEFEGIQIPFATYFQSEAYRKMEQNAKLPRSTKRTYISKAIECLNQTIHLLKYRHVDPNHPLNSVIHAELKRAQQLSQKFVFEVANQSSNSEFDNSFTLNDSFYAPRNHTRRSDTCVSAMEIENLNKQFSNMMSYLKDEFTKTISDEMTNIKKEVQNLKEKVENMRRKQPILQNREEAAHVLDDINIIEDELEKYSHFAGQMGPNGIIGETYRNSPMYGNQALNYYTQQFMMPPRPGVNPLMLGPRPPFPNQPMMAHPNSTPSFVNRLPFGPHAMDNAMNFNTQGIIPPPNVSGYMVPDYLRQARKLNQTLIPVGTQMPDLQQDAVSVTTLPATAVATKSVDVQTSAVINVGTQAVTSPAPATMTFNKALNNMPVEKTPPVNVVITSSDPLPVSNASLLTQRTLSVTIPSHHIKSNIFATSDFSQNTESFALGNAASTTSTPRTSLFDVHPFTPTTSSTTFKMSTPLPALTANQSSETATKPASGAPLTGQSLPMQPPTFQSFMQAPSLQPSSTQSLPMQSLSQTQRTVVSEGPPTAPIQTVTSPAVATTMPASVFSFSFPSSQAPTQPPLSVVKADDSVGNLSSVEDANSSGANKSEKEVGYDPRPDFQPIIPLPDEVEVKTGEENEEVLFSEKAKLHRCIDKEWKERGTGILKILRDTETCAARILMRRDLTHKICANHRITNEIHLVEPKTSSRSFMWVANDFADEELRVQSFLVQFQNTEKARRFKDTFENAKWNATIFKYTPAKNASAKPEEKKDFTSFTSTQPKNNIQITPTNVSTPKSFFGPPKDENNTSKLQLFSNLLITPKASSTISSPKGIFSMSSLTEKSTLMPATITNTSVSKIEDSSNNRDNSVEEFVPTASFEPVIPLPDLVEVATGEENDNVLFEHRAKLLRYNKETKEWKERGIGNMRVLQDKDDVNKLRLVMRREFIYKLCCNQLLRKDTEFVPVKNSVTSLMWVGHDFSDNELQVETLSVRFKTEKICQQFHDAIKAAQAKMTAPSMTENTPNKAGSILKPSKLTHVTTSSQESTTFGKSADTHTSLTPETSPDAKGFGDEFKMKKGEWVCESCYTKNQGTSLQCVACEEPKDKTVSKKQETSLFGSSTITSPMKFNFGFSNTNSDQSIKPPVTSTTNTGFGDAFKPKEGSWSCSNCLVVNDKGKLYCCSCEAPKDNTVPKKEPPNPLKLSNTGVKFQFGFNHAATSTTITPQVPSTPATITSANALSTTTSEQSKSFTSLNSGTQQTKTAQIKSETKPSFTFGLSTKPSENDNKSSCLENNDSDKTPLATAQAKFPSASAGFVFQAMTDTDKKGLTPSQESSFNKSTRTQKYIKGEGSSTISFINNPTNQPKEFSFDKSPIVSDTESKSLHHLAAISGNIKKEFNFGATSITFIPKIGQTTDDSKAETHSEYYQDEENDTQFTPVIPLPDAVEVITGEEDEDVMYSHRAKLYVFRDKEWKERGTGNVKILKHKTTNKLRIIMRREQILKLCLNHLLNKDVIYKKKDGDGSNAWLFAVNDYSDGEVEFQRFCLRFKNSNVADEFMAKIEELLSSPGQYSPISDSGDRSPSPVSLTEHSPVTLGTDPITTYSPMPLQRSGSVQARVTFAIPEEEDDSNDSVLQHSTSEPPIQIQCIPLYKPDVVKPKLHLSLNDSIGANVSNSIFSTPFVSTTGGFTLPTNQSYTTPTVSTKNPSFLEAFGKFNKTQATPVSGGNLFSGVPSPSPYQGHSIFPKSDTAESNLKLQSTEDDTVVTNASKSSSSIFLSPSYVPSTESNIASNVASSHYNYNFLEAFNELNKRESAQQQSGPVSGGNIFSSPPAPSIGPSRPIFGGQAFTMNPANESINKSASAISSGNSLSSSPFAGISGAVPKPKTSEGGIGIFQADKEKPTNHPPGSFMLGNTSTESTFADLVKAAETKDKEEKAASNDRKGFYGLTKQSEFLNFDRAFAAAKKDENTSLDRSGNQSTQSNDYVNDSYDVHFDPIVDLPPEIVKTTGEEDEDKLFGERAKLYRFDSRNKEWKERGTGEIKFLKHKTQGTYRLVMRRELVLNLILNHAVGEDFSLHQSDRSKNSFIWAAMNYHESKPELEKLSVRFRDEKIAAKFYKLITQTVLEIANSRTGLDPRQD